MSCQSSNLNAGPCLEVIQGRTFKVAFSVTGIDLTGATATLTFSGGYPKTLQYEASTVSGEVSIIITTPSVAQTIVVEIDEVNTISPFDSGKYILTVSVAGDVLSLVGGPYSFVRV